MDKFGNRFNIDDDEYDDGTIFVKKEETIKNFVKHEEE